MRQIFGGMRDTPLFTDGMRDKAKFFCGMRDGGLPLRGPLKNYVAANYQRNEILDYMMRDFEQYAWSMRTLDNRLRHFDINYIDRTVQVGEVRAAVLNEIEGPGRLLGYRAMHKKLRLRYGLNTPRNRVYDVMTDVDPEGLENRRPGAKTKKKGSFHSPGPNWV